MHPYVVRDLGWKESAVEVSPAAHTMKIKKPVTPLNPANNNKLTDVQDVASIHVEKIREILFLLVDGRVLTVAIALSTSGARIGSRLKGSFVGDVRRARLLQVGPLRRFIAISKDYRSITGNGALFEEGRKLE